jgi:hypothetical protein
MKFMEGHKILISLLYFSDFKMHKICYKELISVCIFNCTFVGLTSKFKLIFTPTALPPIIKSE